jgi:hypothetical protein
MVKPHERVRITIHDLLTEAQVDQVIVRTQGLHLMVPQGALPGAGATQPVALAGGVRQLMEEVVRGEPAIALRGPDDIGCDGGACERLRPGRRDRLQGLRQALGRRKISRSQVSRDGDQPRSAFVIGRVAGLGNIQLAHGILRPDSQIAGGAEAALGIVVDAVAADLLWVRLVEVFGHGVLDLLAIVVHPWLLLDHGRALGGQQHARGPVRPGKGDVGQHVRVGEVRIDAHLANHRTHEPLVLTPLYRLGDEGDSLHVKPEPGYYGGYPYDAGYGWYGGWGGWHHGWDHAIDIKWRLGRPFRARRVRGAWRRPPLRAC